MTRLIAIPDIHGHNFFEDKIRRILKEQYNEIKQVIFLGDYFDDWDDGMTGKQQIETFGVVIELKEEFPDKITLLLGNHDVHYLYYYRKTLRCSGFQNKHYMKYHSLLYHHRKEFEMAYSYKNILFTHAGISRTLISNVTERYGLFSTEDPDAATICKVLNMMFDADSKEIYYCGKTNGGLDPYDGPLWIRPWTLERSLPKGIIQVVGHTAVNEQLEMYENVHLNAKLVLTDTHPNKRKPIIITITDRGEINFSTL